MPIQPAYLNKNDKVAIVCTARYVEVGELESSIELLKYWGLDPVLGHSIGLKNHQYGGTDDERARDLQNHIDDKSIKAIWCARGGYGTARILDFLDFTSLQKNPKWIIGYSDVTAIHLALQKQNIVSLHAQMALDIENKSKETQKSLRQCLLESAYNIKYKSSFESIDGSTQGILIGGNLSVLYSVMGSTSIPDFENKILFLEDLDEYLYHIDRIFLNLYRSGILKQISGLIIGGMSDMNDNTIPFGKSAYEIIDDYARKLSIPVAYDCPVGHTFHNLALCLGQNIQLSVVNNSIEIEYVYG